MKAQIKKALRAKELQERRGFIQENFTLTDFDYQSFQFEYGMKFLEVVFENDHDLALQIGKCRTFWFWWIKEWNRWERELIEFINDHQPTCYPQFWHDEMLAFVGDQLTTEGFKNYLKLFHNVRLH